MIRDVRELPHQAEIRADVCIVGAGPAGITLAHALSPGPEIALIESGGLVAESEVEAIFADESVGQRYPLAASRLHYLGGASNHWQGRCRPLEPADFEVREWIPWSGWPIRREDLDPYYPRALEICDLPERAFDLAACRAAYPDLHLLMESSTALEPHLYRWSEPTRFGQKYREGLVESGNVTVYLHGTATEIVAGDAARSVRSVRVHSAPDHAAHVSARLFVLATGGIENPRLLLSASGAPPGGLGNGHDLVGRFFMEHPRIRKVATMWLFEPLADHGLHTGVEIDGTRLRVALALSGAAQAQERIPRASFRLFSLPPTAPGVRAGRKLIADLKEGRFPRHLASRLGAVIRDAEEVVRTARETRDERRARFWGYDGPTREFLVELAGEQTPNPESRVTLSTRRGPLGQPRAQLDWRLTPLDWRGLRDGLRVLGRELGRAGLGRLQAAEVTDEELSDVLLGENHHMGTTRMAADPSVGVVDASCRVHGVENLYVAGSSVFATGGTANPTLTIVALALRLAEHLERRLTG